MVWWACSSASPASDVLPLLHAAACHCTALHGDDGVALEISAYADASHRNVRLQ